MPKPAAVEKYIRSWIRDEHRDTVDAWVRVATRSAHVSSSVSGTHTGRSFNVSPVHEMVQEMGKRSDDSCGRLLESAGAWVLSPYTFRVLRLSGFKERVKATELEVPRSELTALWYRDAVAYKNLLRGMVLELADGRYVADTAGLSKALRPDEPGPWLPFTEHFLATLGPIVKPLP